MTNPLTNPLGKGSKNMVKKIILTKGDGGYDYLQSTDDADYTPNLNKLVHRDFDLIFGIGFLIEEQLKKLLAQSRKNFAIIDDVVDQPNVASLMFKDQEGDS